MYILMYCSEIRLGAQLSRDEEEKEKDGTRLD